MDGSLIVGNQRRAVLDEADALGVEVLGSEVVQLEARDLLEDVKLHASLAMTGRGQVQPTEVQRFELEVAGLRFAYAEGYHGHLLVPGEFHAPLRGGLREPVALTRPTFLGTDWLTNDDKALEKRLRRDPALKEAVGSLAWKRRSSGAEIKLAWSLQVFATGTGTSHLVLKTAGAGLVAWRPGIREFLVVFQAVTALLDHEPRAAQEPCFPPAYCGVCGCWRAAGS
ncbi:MAG: hypothetical protein IT373_04470 [Polyangiaceae bacterium]|nr:hypothetical protein [Polyangiaceae bacterium]